MITRTFCIGVVELDPEGPIKNDEHSSDIFTLKLCSGVCCRDFFVSLLTMLHGICV